MLYFRYIVCLNHLIYICIKIIPKTLNSLAPHESFHLVLIALVLNFLEPIHTTCCALSKLILSPDTFAKNSSSTESAWLRDSVDPSKKIDVSSVYCEILNSVPFICIPLVLLLCLVLLPEILHRG